MTALEKLAARLKNPDGGLTAAGRRHYAKTEGANLKPGVKNPDEAGDSEKKRWARWAVRFYSNPRGPMTNDKGEPTRLALMANAWGTKVPKTREEAQAIAARGRKILESAREKKSGEGHLDKNDPDIYITEDGRRTRRGLWANVALKKKREKRSAYEDGSVGALGSLGLEKAADDVIYKTRFSGIPVHVDRPKGTKKHYRLHGKTTNITYRNDYGFIPGIVDHDGEDLDVHLGPNKKSDKVFLVQKLKGPPGNLEFDEHKVLLGYDSRRTARNVADYYFSKIRSQNMKEMTISEFKDLIKKGPLPKPNE